MIRRSTKDKSMYQEEMTMLYPTLWRARRTPVWNGLSRRNFDRVFDGFFLGDSESGSLKTWSPVTDVREDADGLLLSIELPGMGSDEVKVSLENGVLSIAGEKKREVEEGKEGGDYHLVERRYGRFERTFTLPRGIDTDKASAKFENGVLEIALPKSAKAKPKLIPVK
jgi:HSP20 family protein